MLHGVDLSVYQRNVAYDALAEAIDFAYVKCCDATNHNGIWVCYEDAQHQTHTTEIRKRKKPTGDYAFGHPYMDVSKLAAYFVAHAMLDMLRPVIDMETLAGGVVPANAASWCLKFLDAVATATGGIEGIIYTSTSYGKAMLAQDSAIGNFDLWEAQYSGSQTPPLVLPAGAWPRVVAHQWTGTGRIAGVTGNADLDIAEDINRLYIVPMVDPAPEANEPPS